MHPPITVVAVDDHSIVLDGIAGRLKPVETIELLAVGRRGSEVLPLVAMHHPDILVLDMGMPTNDGEEDRFEAIAAIERITSDYPNTKTIVLSQNIEPILIKAAIQAGANGYIDKLDMNSSVHLPVTIDIVHAGGIYFSSSVHRKLSSGVSRNAIDLSKQQSLVVYAIATTPNAAHKELAIRMGISESTFKKHLGIVLEKMNVTNKTAAVLKAVKLGFVSIDILDNPEYLSMYMTQNELTKATYKRTLS